MSYPAVFSVPAPALQPPFAVPPFGPVGPLYWTVLLTIAGETTTTTTPKPSPGTQVIVLPYPVPPAVPAAVPAAAPGSCNINCPAAWEPVCAVNGAGYMYNFANLCALNAQNCVSGTDFRYLYSGICSLKR